MNLASKTCEALPPPFSREAQPRAAHIKPIVSLRAAKHVNPGDDEEEPRITRIRADGPSTSFGFIRAYPRNPRSDLCFNTRQQNT
jgi:hypothetical protein